MTIHTLIKDIYDVVGKQVSEEFQQRLSEGIAKRLAPQLRRQEDKGGMRLSKMGPTCPRAYWYSVHRPDLAEAPPPWAKIKFTYGHILEALAIELAKEAGYDVVGEQDELELLGVKGHRDCIIGGCTVDIKSCSGRVFDKFKI